MTRNKELVAGVEKYTRSQMYAKKALYKKKKVVKAKAAATTEKPVVAETKTVEVKGAKNGKTRTVQVKKQPKLYPAEDVQKPKKTRKSPKPAKLRSSIQPGTVLILLAGRHRGKRVVYLRQLKSGLLLVSGPFAVNGVPLRRVNQAYVLATSTRVDVSAVQLSDQLTSDEYYKNSLSEKKSEKKFFDSEGKRINAKVSEVKQKDQQTVDAQLLAAIKKVDGLEGYLKQKFSLQNGQYPHLLKF